jgi:hypothetical protein
VPQCCAPQHTSALPQHAAGYPRVSKIHRKQEVDGQVKPGHHEREMGELEADQFCTLTPSITTVEAELEPTKLELRTSRRSVPLIHRLRVSL